MKVVLVDDEAYIVEYLKHLIHWQDLGFFEMFSFSDPLCAKERLKKGDIDLLITDIAMPEISGIDLLKFIWDKNLPTETIFLSSYSEFKYAQQAIRYGLTDYLLKPVTKETLELALHNVLEERIKKSEKELLSPEHLLFYQLSVFEEIHEVNSTESYCFIYSKKKSFCSDHASYLKFDDKNSYGLLNVNNECNQFIKTSKSFLGNETFEIRKNFYDFFYQITEKNITYYKIENTIQEYFQKLKNNERLTNSYHEFYLKFNEKEKIVFLVNAMAFLFLYSDKNISKEADIFHLTNDNQQKKILQCLEEYYARNYQFFSVKEIINKTNHYIAANLEKDLSLELLASRAYLNPAYFSTLYKQETGINISVYIQERRLDYAVKLLVETSLKVSDIGEMVGYPHIQYFTKIFKGRFGITPNRYRKRNIR